MDIIYHVKFFGYFSEQSKFVLFLSESSVYLIFYEIHGNIFKLIFGPKYRQNEF